MVDESGAIFVYAGISWERDARPMGCTIEERLVDIRYACDGADPGHVVVVPDCPSHVPEHGEEHAGHEDETILRLVDPAVVQGHPDDDPVVERPGDEQREHDPYERSKVCQALVEERHGDKLGVRGKGQGSGNAQLGMW